MDNLKDTGSPDRDRINMHEEYEVQYWAKKFGVRPEQLREAGKRANSSVASKIQEALGELGHN